MIAKSTSPLGETPYWVFVSFLYAWVAAGIGERFSSLSLHWSEYSRSKPRFWHVPVWSHLTLAAFIVATSWLGWTLAFLLGDVPGIDIGKGVIVPTSLLLIVDFWILGTYFAFVLVVNEARLAGRSYGRWSRQAGHAAYWVLWIQVAYLVWDFFTYFVIPCWESGKGDASWSWVWVGCAALAGALVLLRWFGRIGPIAPLVRFSLIVLFFLGLYFCIPWKIESGVFLNLWDHSWMSVLGIVLAWFAFWLSLTRSQTYGPFGVLASDASLLALVLFYRALKQLSAHCQVGHLTIGCETESIPPCDAIEQMKQVASKALAGWEHIFETVCFSVFAAWCLRQFGPLVWQLVLAKRNNRIRAAALRAPQGAGH